MPHVPDADKYSTSDPSKTSNLSVSRQTVPGSFALTVTIPLNYRRVRSHIVREMSCFVSAPSRAPRKYRTTSRMVMVRGRGILQTKEDFSIYATCLSNLAHLLFCPFAVAKAYVSIQGAAQKRRRRHLDICTYLHHRDKRTKFLQQTHILHDLQVRWVFFNSRRESQEQL